MSLNVVSLFSGGGGLDLGFLANGYNIIWASDIDKNAVDTYKHNIGNHIIQADLNEIDIQSIPKSKILIGGPPCQSFSLIGKRDTNDHRGKLVWKYLEILEHVNPEAFVFENVTGILSAKDSNGNKVIDLLVRKFSELGYIVTWKIINAAEYGVPQKRKRVIIVGLKNEKFIFPEETHFDNEKGKNRFVSVEEALDDLPPASKNISSTLKYLSEPTSDYQKEMRGKTVVVTDHYVQTTSELDKYIIKHVKPGGNYMDVPSTVNSERIKRLQKDGGHTTCYGRLHPDNPSYTINTYFNRPNVGCNIHYKYDRLITVREALRLQSFPDDYNIISSSKKGRNTIVGNAVPPKLAAIIAKQLKKYLV
ncbi:DNA (cytosine-5-)-methyltransferase (plasmid) [Tenericutes bacterium MO-XQ]|nr:DNA (cytosine-5-)-methyltransferase [Tenericutes bacterium MO-XQ]